MSDLGWLVVLYIAILAVACFICWLFHSPLGLLVLALLLITNLSTKRVGKEE